MWPTRCGTRVSTCRRRSSKCACRSPTKPALTVGGATVRRQAAGVHHRHPAAGRVRPAGRRPCRGLPGLHGIGLRRPARGRGGRAGGPRHNARSAPSRPSAAERGAVALIVANNDDGDEMGGTLGAKTDVKIPVISVTKAIRRAAARRAGRDHHQAQRRRARRAHPQRHRPDQDRVHRRRRDGRRAPRQRARGAGDQRQRLRGGGGAGNRAAAGQLAAR